MRSILASFALLLPSVVGAAPPDFIRDVQPIFTKYCTGCHNQDEREGKLSLASHADLLKGGEHGAAVVPAASDRSRLVLMLTAKAEPVMPPKGEAAPTAAEVALLRAWIDAGAKGPSGAGPDPTLLVTPKIPLTAPPRATINALALSPAGDLLALAGSGEVALAPFPEQKPVRKLPGHRGSVNAVAFSRDGKLLAAAAGEPGLFGEVRLWDVASGSLIKTLQGHADSIYSVALSGDGKLLATGGYDNLVLLWDLSSGQIAKRLEGHNGAVFEVAFRPDGKVLASCSGDRTVKLWDVASGARLDTLKESTKELYALAFDPTGKRLAAAGVDNRIRVWEISPRAQEGTNPLLFSQFAHETPVLRLAWSAEGDAVVSTGEDRLVKVWNAETLALRSQLPKQSDWASGVAIERATKPAAPRRIVVGRIDGTVSVYPLPAITLAEEKPLLPAAEYPPEVDYGPQPKLEALAKVKEAEPNDQPAQATPLTIPGVGVGVIRGDDRRQEQDFDLFAIDCRAGEQWILETKAARAGSLLDSKLELLDAAGKPVPQVLLRAVRDTEIEFRGMNSEQRGVRLKYWEEMLLNQYVFLNGEVIKHFQQRRGPDADSQFYPENGNRMTFFGTTPRAHALGEPGYVVVPYPLGTELPNNGLPIFTLNYENDDDAHRKLGKDSSLTFVAPRDGRYLARVSDVRGFAGEKYHYELIVRRPQPNFKVSFSPTNPTVNAGSGKAFVVKADRIDGFQGPIQVAFENLPPGFSVSGPVEIPAGLYEAQGVLYAAADAPPPTKENESAAKITARAIVAGKEHTLSVTGLGAIKRADKPKLLAYLELAEKGEATFSGEPPEIVLTPGGSVTCKLRVERNGFDELANFEVENLPHGVIVDDIGLSGVAVRAKETERTIFLRAEPWVQPQTRLFHGVAKVEGNQATNPLRIRVVPRAP